MRAFAVVFAFAFTGLLSHCNRSDVVNPDEGPGTGYPCGRWGVECSDHTCCPWAHTCGGPDRAGFTRCEPGYCCYTGDPMYGSGDAGADSGAQLEGHAPVQKRKQEPRR